MKALELLSKLSNWMNILLVGIVILLGLGSVILYFFKIVPVEVILILLTSTSVFVLLPIMIILTAIFIIQHVVKSKK